MSMGVKAVRKYLPSILMALLVLLTASGLKAQNSTSNHAADDDVRKFA